MVLGIPTSPVEKVSVQMILTLRYRGKTLYGFSL
jgi:hypothetical protein